MDWRLVAYSPAWERLRDRTSRRRNRLQVVQSRQSPKSARRQANQRRIRTKNRVCSTLVTAATGLVHNTAANCKLQPATLSPSCLQAPAVKLLRVESVSCLEAVRVQLGLEHLNPLLHHPWKRIGLAEPFDRSDGIDRGAQQHNNAGPPVRRLHTRLQHSATLNLTAPTTTAPTSAAYRNRNRNRKRTP